MAIVVNISSPGDTSSALLVSQVVNAAATLLLDMTHRRWPQSEKISWINEAMSAILFLKPEAFAKTTPLSLAYGSYQQIPIGSAVFMGLTRNLGTDGLTPGRAIRPSVRSSLDDADPNWHTMSPSNVIRHFMAEPNMPRVFYVYPPAQAGTKVELEHAVLPGKVTLMTDIIGIAPEYLPAITNYVAYRCNLKDSEYANGQVAALFYQAFTAALGITPTGAPQ